MHFIYRIIFLVMLNFEMTELKKLFVSAIIFTLQKKMCGLNLII